MGKKISLAVGTTLVGLLFIELVIRLLGTAPGVTRLQVDLPHGTFQSSRNALLRYEPRPGSPGVSDYGIRDRDYDLDKPNGGLRLMVIGDSIGYGFCNDRETIALDDLFMKQLEQNLRRQSSDPIDVINLCVSGYDTVQEVEFLAEKGLAFQPDIVLVSYCLNDDFDASMELNYFRQQPQFGIDNVIGKKAFLASHLVRLIWLRNWKPDPQPRPTRRPVREKISRTERGFERLAALGKEHGFQPIVVVFPLFEPLDTYRWHKSHQRVAALANRYGMQVIDLLEPFKEASHGNLRLMQGRCNREHPDERGHEAAAIAIEKHLRETGLVPLP